MSKTTTFEAWAVKPIRMDTAYLFMRERDVRGWAAANNRTSRPRIEPVRVRVTVETIEEGEP